MQSKEKILISFGERVRKLRKERCLSQEQLAFRADLHRTYIGMIERAEKNITLVNIEKIAVALNVALSTLFNAEEKRKFSGHFINEEVLIHAGLTSDILNKAISYAHDILDDIDEKLLNVKLGRISQLVELANLSSMIGNILGAGIEKFSNGKLKRNKPHKFPDILAVDKDCHDIEIKIALEKNKPKGHLAKAGYYLTFRYVLIDEAGGYQHDARGKIAEIWEARFGYLEESHFNLSNTDGDSGKTAVINKDGMSSLNVVYFKSENCPYSVKSPTYKLYQNLINNN